ncbi:MAG: hypothetical protein PW791_13635 [Neorhizobium sp.]|jgi:hypothetical protein|nr:hypothetical protein [Neorhizobium sp.]
MTIRFRPTHSGFDTLQLAGMSPRSTQGYHHFGSATNEQLTSRAMARPIGFARPAAVFADFRER